MQTLDTFSICDAKRKTQQKTLRINEVSLDTMETNNSFVYDFTQNTLEIWTNANANVKFYLSRCVLLCVRSDKGLYYVAPLAVLRSLCRRGATSGIKWPCCVVLQLKCCGVESKDDWGDAVPVSCCVAQVEEEGERKCADQEDKYFTVVSVEFIKAETHLAASVQRNPVRSNRIHASIVYCADLAIYAI